MITLIAEDKYLPLVQGATMRNKQEIDFINKPFSVKQLKKVVSKKESNLIVLSFSFFKDEVNTILLNFVSISKTVNTPIVIIASYLPDFIVNEMKSQGLKHIITSDKITEQKKELIQIIQENLSVSVKMTETQKEHSPPPIEETLKVVETKQSLIEEPVTTEEPVSPAMQQLNDFMKKLDAKPTNVTQQFDLPKVIPPPQIRPRKTITIAVAGICGRIGTTTTSLQIIKYLQQMERKTCYIQFNDSKHIEKMLTVYGEDCTNLDTKKGYFECADVPIFYLQESISKALSEQYDFIVYDFGSMENLSLPVFIEKDIKILCCGTKPWENENLNKYLSKLLSEEINYIFTFSHKSEHETVRNFMEEEKSRTYFADYTPDMFSLPETNERNYQYILRPYLIELKDTTETPVKQRKFAFGRRY